jgi:hypothetical protein
LPTLNGSGRFVKKALIDLLGHKAMLSFLVVDDFVRHLAATVNSLARGHSALRLCRCSPHPDVSSSSSVAMAPIWRTATLNATPPLSDSQRQSMPLKPLRCTCGCTPCSSRLTSN